jgi:hypothetical protein
MNVVKKQMHDEQQSSFALKFVSIKMKGCENQPNSAEVAVDALGLCIGSFWCPHQKDLYARGVEMRKRPPVRVAL